MDQSDAAACRQVETEYFDSIKLKLCDLASVEVRAMSFGPGACAVEISADTGETIALLAPPAIWTGWTVLMSHITDMSIEVSNNVICDTGVRTQVRYFTREPQVSPALPSDEVKAD